MASTRGRQVVVPLTNKSGGGVVAGDVVIVDTANDDAFTTTTSAAYTGGVGIAQDTIANNAVGRVLLEGYAALVNVAASVTRGHYGTTHTVAKQATSAAARGAGTFCEFLTGGTTPTARVYPVDLQGAAGAVASDAIWDAAGDLAVGSGANTAAKLTKGAAGAYLGQYNGVVGWNGGTSFPASPATGDRYWRSDLLTEGVYDGAQWLETGPMQRLHFGGQTLVFPTSANTTLVAIPNEQDFDLYMYDLHLAFYVATTNDGTKYWTFNLVKNAGGTIVSGNTSADSASTWTKKKVAVNALLGTSVVSLDLSAVKTSTPGTLYYGGWVSCRRVLT